MALEAAVLNVLRRELSPGLSCAVTCLHETDLLQTVSSSNLALDSVEVSIEKKSVGYALQMDQDGKMLHCNLVARS